MILRPRPEPRSASLSPAETELLLCCARRTLSPDQRARTRALLGEDLRWDILLRAAVAHRVLPLLYTHLKAFAADGVPQPVLTTMGELFAKNARRSLLLLGELRAILRLFESKGIPAVPYKGPVLAEQIYGNPALRQINDLDILVPKGDVLEARKLLIGRGYRPAEPATRTQDRALLRGDCNYVLRRDEDEQIVELHWAFTTRHASFDLHLGDLQDDLQYTSVAGTRMPLIPPELLLVILCFHGSKHMWERLEWICGIAELTAANDIDWETVFARAGQLRSRRILLLGLRLADELLGASLPKEIRRQTRSEPRVARLASQVKARLFSGDDRLANTLGMPFHLFQLRAEEHLGNGFRYVYRAAFAPAPEDWTAVPLPDALFPLYFLIRPIRLVVDYGLRFAGAAR